MRFLWPEMLWTLLLIPVLLVGYVWLLRRRMRVAVIAPDLSAIRLAQAGRRNYRRHIPPALCLAAIACGLIGSAGPSARVVLPADYMTLVLAMDVSRSMLAEDVPPNRIKASQEAVKAFIEGLPQNVRVGLVTFAGTAQRAHGITDNRQDIYEAIDRFQLQPGTATGSGLAIGPALQARGQVPRAQSRPLARRGPTVAAQLFCSQMAGEPQARIRLRPPDSQPGSAYGSTPLHLAHLRALFLGLRACRFTRVWMRRRCGRWRRSRRASFFVHPTRLISRASMSTWPPAFGWSAKTHKSVRCSRWLRWCWPYLRLVYRWSGLNQCRCVLNRTFDHCA